MAIRGGGNARCKMGNWEEIRLVCCAVEDETLKLPLFFLACQR